MSLMSEERRKEMEEEMNRFELEIAGPGETKASSTAPSSKNSKPLSPPPAPPSVSVLIPDALIKAPPPPPPPLSPPSSTTPTMLRPPPPPPSLQGPPPASPQSPASVRFIPHQLQRQPPKPPLRPNYMSMSGPPGPFPPPGPFGPQHQAPPMSSMPPMGHMSMGHMPPMGHVPTGPPMPPMHGPMHPMSHGVMPMHMPHQMGMGLPMPPGFCPPSALPMNMTGDSNEQQYFNPNNSAQGDDIDVSASDAPSSTSESSSVVEASPAIYAAPFVKTLSENASATVSSTNGQITTTTVSTSANVSNFQKVNKSFPTKTEDSTVGPNVPTSTSNEETVVSKKKEKKKKIVRMAGGQAWEDNSLLDWETDDFRIFCGDLGNDVTDEVLIRAFSKYPSFGKAKVIRDKRTNKTKGYGFVSFKDPQDFIKAMREMNGRYVGSRPIKLRKSTWRDRNIDLVKKKQKEKEKLGLL
ncbi:RNA-binding protein 42 [Parasteatoda tepidariorum]|nr:RNA-binding protein 42 [Parasteatoda tepidariorum]